MESLNVRYTTSLQQDLYLSNQLSYEMSKLEKLLEEYVTAEQYTISTGYEIARFYMAPQGKM